MFPMCCMISVPMKASPFPFLSFILLPWGRWPFMLWTWRDFFYVSVWRDIKVPYNFHKNFVGQPNVIVILFPSVSTMKGGWFALFSKIIAHTFSAKVIIAACLPWNLWGSHQIVLTYFRNKLLFGFSLSLNFSSLLWF